MIDAAELAGVFAAHAIWCVSKGETLIPMLAYVEASGERKMERLAFDKIEAGVIYGRQKLLSNDMNAEDAVLVYDGRIPIGTEKCDAIIIEIRSYLTPDSEVVIAVPYTPGTSGRFRVHKPKLLVWKECEDYSMEAVIEAFFQGVATHETGSQVWSESLDESK